MKTKKILSVLLVALMAFALSGMTAFAASITVEKPDTDGTDNTQYTYYQILKASIDGDNVAYYVEDEAQATALEGTGLFTVKKVVSGDYWTVELADENTSGEDIAAALDGIKDQFTASDAFKAGEKQEVEDGYYLVVSSLGTKVIVDTFKTDTIKEKNGYPSLTKDVDKSSASIGEEVTYTVTVTVPETVANKEIVIVDTIDEALTRSAKAKVGNAEIAFSGDNLTIPAATVVAAKGSTITVTYTATLNDKAAIKTALKNKAHLVYAGFTSVDVETTVKTYGFSVIKYDGTTEDTSSISSEEKEALAGAKFTLWDAKEGGNQIYVKLVDGVYRVDISKEASSNDVIEAGTATVEGLKEGTYYLQEDEAPAGYNKLAERVKVAVGANTAGEEYDVSVANKAGTELPSTGAMGTTIFYIVGVLAILGAGVFMVTNKRIAKEEF